MRQVTSSTNLYKFQKKKTVGKLSLRVSCSFQHSHGRMPAGFRRACLHIWPHKTPCYSSWTAALHLFCNEMTSFLPFRFALIPRWQMDLLRCSPSNWLQHFWKSQSAIGVLFAMFVAVRHEGMIDTSLRHRSGSSMFQVQRTSASILNLQRLNTILELVNLCPIFLRNVQIISNVKSCLRERNKSCLRCLSTLAASANHTLTEVSSLTCYGEVALRQSNKANEDGPIQALNTSFCFFSWGLNTTIALLFPNENWQQPVKINCSHLTYDSWLMTTKVPVLAFPEVMLAM